MAIPKAHTIRLRIVYDGTLPNRWDGGPNDFGRVCFDVTLEVKPEHTAVLIFLGDFVHGPPKERFLYLSWRNANGAYAQRLKLPLGGLTWRDVEQGTVLVGEVAPSKKPRVPGASNLGGTRAVVWRAVDQ